MKANIFYSWQSDLDYKNHKNYIEKAIKQAIKIINKNDNLIAILDKDTKNEIGSPNIVDTIFRKIEKSKFFICDLSFVSKDNISNPNVLIELGYAIKVLGWNKIICLFNINSGSIENLPFDVNHNRITQYDSQKGNLEVNRIAEIIQLNLQSLFKDGLLFNPTEDYMKMKIDKILLDIIGNIINFIFSSEETINYSKLIKKIVDINSDELEKQLTSNYFIGFYFLQDYTFYSNELSSILDKLYMSEYFDDCWKKVLIEIIDWIEIWHNTIDERFSPNLYTTERQSEYIVISAFKMNNENSKDSYLLLKKKDNESGIVIKAGYLKKYNIKDSISIICIDQKYISIIVKRIKDFFLIVENWMDITGYEFILDPKYYKIGNFQSVIHSM